jgi:hypothetical protein
LTATTQRHGAAANAPGLAYGLYAADAFRVVNGNVSDATALPQALWYFRDEVIALPVRGRPVAGFTPGVPAAVDLVGWIRATGPAAPTELPPLVWITAAHQIAHGRLTPDGQRVTTTEGSLPAHWWPRHRLNRSYIDASSLAFLAARDLRLRGEFTEHGFTIRSVWPIDFRLDPALPARALVPANDSRAALRALWDEVPRGGAASPFAAWRLWDREAGIRLAGKPALAFIVNGAQGDDDEAHAGHFAIASGRIADDGGIDDWLVNDFYNLDCESEKGIIAAPVPLDSYLGDLNAGQSWYRPSLIVVAVLRNADAALWVQAALGRIYNHFYRHQLVYYHPDVNCTSISVDTLRALGFDIAQRAPAHPLLATLGFPLLVARERSVAKAKAGCDYLSADPVRLLPAAALEEIFAALLAIAAQVAPAAAGTTLAARLRRDLDALVAMRIPQFPSARAWGDVPAPTIAEFRARLPDDPAALQIVPVPARPFPDALRAPDLLQRPMRRSDLVAMAWGLLLVVGVPAVLRAAWRRIAAARRRRSLSPVRNSGATVPLPARPPRSQDDDPRA